MVSTLQILRLRTSALIYGIWICSLVNLVLSYLHINSRKWGTLPGALALLLASSMSVASALLLFFKSLKKGYHDRNAIALSSPATKRSTASAMRYVWLLFSSLAAEGIAFLVLTIISIFFRQMYENALLVWNHFYSVCWLNLLRKQSVFCALLILDMRFFPFKLFHKGY
jgi:spore maturation protein SpmB